MKVEIAPIKNEYSEAVVDLILNIQQKEFGVPITIADQPDLFIIDQFYYGAGGCFWGAFINGELVGTIALIKFDKDAGAIRKMFVKKGFRGKELKIAQQLLEVLIAYSREIGLNNLYLGTVTILEAAIRFYERNNFVKIAKDQLPATFPLMNPDNVFCQLTLN